MIFAAVLCAVVENDELCCEENEELGDVTDGDGVFAVPHFGQNLVVSLICAPQFLQNIKKSFFLHKNGGDDSPFPFYKKLDKKSRKTKDSFLISINPTIVSGNTYG